MNDAFRKSCTAFDGHRRLRSGPLPAVALAVKTATEGGAAGPVLIYDDATGRVIDIDTRGTDEDVLARLSQAFGASAEEAAPSPAGADLAGAESAGTESSGEPRGRGRPKLGVVAREVTLLPRHWDWLGRQPGGASVALRKLVEEARRANIGRDRRREMQETAYRVMSALAGNLPNFEEATRALFANDRQRFEGLIAIWPEDVAAYVARLAFAEHEPGGAEST
ncbi:hypothetical protein SAMN05519103_05765 [Rhizobiales bacterium GAS113]|jgi:hypothetical protein|nr:hypothetical protein SAMN05519103_05765 [Rhizobiales bacterium GAS113]SED81306.1 hypothetical protein SAMN05519104_4439 [Rhizobiales bacterium GAS188]